MTEIKVTWGFAWALFWRWVLIYLGISIIIWVILYFTVLAAIMSFLGGWGTF